MSTEVATNQTTTTSASTTESTVPTTTSTTNGTTTTTTSTTTAAAAPKPRSDRSLAAANKKKSYYTDIDWKDLTPIGFEFDTWEDMKKEGWSFPELKRELSTGELSDRPHPLYMYLGAQPIVEGNGTAFNMPYIVIFDSPTPPPSKVCNSSIQSGSEEVHDFSAFHLSWAPYMNKKYSNQGLGKEYKLFTLNLQERTGKKISEEKLNSLTYLLPFILIPKIFETVKIVPVTNVEFVLKDCKLTKEAGEKMIKERKEEELAYKKWMDENKAKKKAERSDKDKPNKPPTKLPYRVETDDNGKIIAVYKDCKVYYDKQTDTVSDFKQEFCEDEGLDKSMEPILVQALKDEFQRCRDVIEKKYQEMKKEVESYSQKKKDDYDNCKIYKFYPYHKKYIVQKYVSPTINRYFGNATKTFPEAIVTDLSQIKEKDADEVKKAAKESNNNAEEDFETLKKREKEERGVESDDESESEDEEESEEEEEVKPKRVIKAPSKPPAKTVAKKGAKKGKQEKKEEKEEEADEEMKEKEEEAAEEEEKEEKEIKKPSKPTTKGKKAATKKETTATKAKATKESKNKKETEKETEKEKEEEKEEEKEAEAEEEKEEEKEEKEEKPVAPKSAKGKKPATTKQTKKDTKEETTKPVNGKRKEIEEEAEEAEEEETTKSKPTKATSKSNKKQKTN